MTTFNPADKSANSVLTNGNLTAAVNSSASGGVRGTTSKGAGKFYIEYAWATSGPNLLAAGFAAGAADLEDAVGGDTNSPIVRENGNIRLSGLNSGFAGATISNGSVACVAIDFDNEKIWFRIDGGNWNNSGSDDPATNTGGLSIAGFPDLFPYAGMDRASNTATANFGGSAFAFTAPAGFGAWDAETPSSGETSDALASDERDSDEALSSDRDLQEAASSDELASDAAASDDEASDAADSDEADSSDAEDASSDKPALDAASSSDKPANDAASSDDEVEAASSSEAAEAASSDKAEDDAFSSDHHEAISSDALVSDADLSERISSDIQDEIAAAPAPPIQTVLTLSS